MKFITLFIESTSEIWGHHTGEIEGQPLKYKIRNPGLWPCHLNDCNSRKILILLWNRKAWLHSQPFMGGCRRYSL
jgi:hypothetical protein